MTEKSKTATVTISVDEYNELKNKAEKPMEAEKDPLISLRDYARVMSKMMEEERDRRSDCITEIRRLSDEITSIQKMSWFDFKVYKHNKKFKNV